MGAGRTTRGRSLERALRRIVAAALASPLATACHAGGDADAPPSVDAAADAPDAPDAADASTACDPSPLDAAAFEDADDGCATFRLLPCGLPPDAGVRDCLPSLDTCIGACGPDLLFYCQLAPVTCSVDAGLLADAAAVVECISCAGASGRRPLGLLAGKMKPGNPTGDYFAAAAHLEAASVRAFRDLARWLAAYGAPARLVRAARRAAGDERRHARAMGRLARRFGGSPPRVRVRATPRPPLVVLLEDDAIAGCVGEALGALVAAWQGETAADPRVRRTLRAIAADEARHAALAWDVMEWGLAELDVGDRTRIARALDAGAAALTRRVPPGLPEAARRATGHPPRAVERAMGAALARLVRADARGALGRLDHVSNPPRGRDKLTR